MYQDTYMICTIVQSFILLLSNQRLDRTVRYPPKGGTLVLHPFDASLSGPRKLGPAHPS